MRFYADEVLTVGDSTPVNLTASKLDHDGGARASRATLQVKSGAIQACFVTDPTSDQSVKWTLDDIFEIIGYDNLKQVKFLSVSGESTLYVTYET